MSWSRQPLRYIRWWISRKTLEIEPWFQRTAIRIWPMWDRMVTRPMTSRDPQRWCEAVWSDVVSTAWLLVYVYWRWRAHCNIHNRLGSLVRLQTDEHTHISVITRVWDCRSISEKNWNCVVHFRYRGSIQYRDTGDGIVIVAPISGIAQHYCLACVKRNCLQNVLFAVLLAVVGSCFRNSTDAESCSLFSLTRA